MELKKTKHLDCENDTIIALCTPRGSGAIALLRLSGKSAINVANSISKLSSQKKLINCDTNTINHGYVINNNDIIDEVLFLLMYGPKTFTGQDTVEISCHNNPFIIQKIINIAIQNGARMAQPGEFTKRAFLNGKIDLIQAESIHDVICAQTELSLQKSMSQLQGTLSSYLLNAEGELMQLLSIVEGGLEFFEEENIDLDIDNMIKNKLNSVLNNLQDLKINFNQQQQIKDGIKICIIGSVNAGKSTLFNALLKKDRAIVTQIEGTTRDSIECSIYKNGNFWQLIDTAGLRQTEDFIEQEGIQKSFDAAASSDIILLTVDGSSQLSAQQIKTYKDIYHKYQDKIVFVINKSDILQEGYLHNLGFVNNKKMIKICAKNKLGIDFLENKVEDKVQELFAQLKSPFLLNQRQYNLIVQLENKLRFIVKECINPIEYELVAYHVREALEQFAQITGRNINEKMLDNAFKNFCIGK